VGNENAIARFVRSFHLSVERHRMPAAAFECGSTGSILGYPFQAKDEVGQDYLSPSEDFELTYRIFGFSYLSERGKDRPQAQ
jgi:hypothetical protein